MQRRIIKHRLRRAGESHGDSSYDAANAFPSVAHAVRDHVIDNTCRQVDRRLLKPRNMLRIAKYSFKAVLVRPKEIHMLAISSLINITLLWISGLPNLQNKKGRIFTCKTLSTSILRTRLFQLMRMMWHAL